MSSSKRETSPARLLDAATRYAQRGVRSKREVVAYLHRRGASADQGRRIAAACHARGVVDDVACARLWAEHWARQGFAWSAIASKLSTKGLQARSIEHARDALGGSSDDPERARRVAYACLQRHQGSRAAQWVRAARALASRGFDPDLIDHVLADILGSLPADVVER